MKTFLIAEAGINHDGDLQRAKDLAYAAKDCGCSAVKFQTYQTDKRVAKDNPVYDILKRCELNYDQQTELSSYCDDIGIEFFSTPFDLESLVFLVRALGVKRIKIASFDITNGEFLRELNSICYEDKYKYTVLLSTGMANSKEIENAISSLVYIRNVIPLHCVSAYPCPDNKTNLSAIRTLKFRYRRSGYSDHTSGIYVPALSILAGASVVEKHFTLDLNGPGVDNPVSADPAMMKELVRKIETYEQILGDGELKMDDIERSSEIFRRVVK